MSKYIQLIVLLAFLSMFNSKVQAQYYDEDIFEPWDTIVHIQDYKLKVQVLNYDTFKDLENKYAAPLAKSSNPIKELERVEKLLGLAYRMSYEKDSFNSDEGLSYYYRINFIEKKGVYRQMLSGDSDGFQAYYPKEKIFLYFGGHSSDQAFFIDTGESAYNPNYSAIQKENKYRLIGMHNGQEGIDGEIQKKDEKTGKYSRLFYISELWRLLYPTIWSHEFWTAQFWHGNTLYMCLGYGNYANKGKEEWDRNNTFIAITFSD